VALGLFCVWAQIVLPSLHAYCEAKENQAGLAESLLKRDGNEGSTAIHAARHFHSVDRCLLCQAFHHPPVCKTHEPRIGNASDAVMSIHGGDTFIPPSLSVPCSYSCRAPPPFS
jgi:hypothetical protein